ncbi:MAG: phosphoribosyltransferase domain-containing protein [Lachnospiraceae bacterium]|nr:phosphoribosyltransferase domain-containing protein [Lachnospiraceae bacterium]
MYTEAELVRIAKRENNTRRKYLVVNRLQGKHIPVSPKEALQMFRSLAELIKEAYPSERLLMVGFAETATAIGAAVAIECQAAYMQTTREVIDGVDYLYFSESHSHATEQKLVKTDLDKIIGKTDRIVFIEDEVTTGNTILNIVRLIQKTYAQPVSSAVASILNGMNEEALENYKNLKIPVHYLVKTAHDTYTEIAEQYQADGTCHICTKPQEKEVEQQKEVQQQIEMQQTKEAQQPIEVQEISGWINARRLHTADTYKQACEQLWQEIQQKYGYTKYTKETETGRRILVLGTEEFMYPALYVGAKLEEAGYTVRMHATTRSPIAVSKEEKYPLHTRYELASLYDKNRTTFVYDLAEYEEVLVLTDAQKQETEGWESLQRALTLNHNRQIRGIRWC